ncbi:MAG: helix-turn-helix domain-containing protein [Rhizobiaceae bacterium]|nr:helix-turn-helix domain-containing protein [Rhizobiaceae bacterium]MCV0408812.1 helix-turn-helix domain-containing protein [Rhizobiaceae bacterium]
MQDDPPLKLRSMPVSGSGPLFLRRPVPAGLRGLVDSIVAYDEGGIPLTLSPEFAPLVFPISLSFGDPFEIALGRAPRAEERWASFTAGLFPSYVLVNSTGHARCIQIDLTPAGACRLFCMPLSELSGLMVPLSDLGDPDILLLVRRLGDLGDWNARLDLVETWLEKRLSAAASTSREIDAAWRVIVGSGGNMRIGALSDRLGWSRKHLVHRFRREIGLPPKTVARMARFHRALAFAGGVGANRLADVAHECGYADQSHFNRDFLEFAGRTPGEWRASLA